MTPAEQAAEVERILSRMVDTHPMGRLLMRVFRLEQAVSAALEAADRHDRCDTCGSVNAWDARVVHTTDCALKAGET